MYGRLIDGKLVQAPAYIVEGDRTIYNPSSTTLATAGYKPVQSEPYPETADEDNEAYYTPEYVEQEEQIVRRWIASEPPKLPPQEPTPDERISDLEGAVMELAEIVSEMMGGE